MEKSSLIAIYRSLDKKETRELGKWLDSPVHNQRQDVRDLHNYLTGSGRLDKPAALEKERVWRKLFPKERFEDAKMRQVIHFSLKSTESWLSYCQLREDAVMERLALAKQLRQRSLDRELVRTLKQVDKLQVDTAYRNEDYFRNEYLLQQEHYTYRAARRRTEKDLNLQPVADALDQAYLIEKLKLCCRMLFHQRLSKTPYQTGMLEPVVNYVEANELQSTPALAIFYYVLKAITNENNSTYFERLRKTVRTHGHLLPVVDQREVYLMAINLCIPKLNSGQEEYVREAFEWYRQGFDSGILLEYNSMTRYTYINVAFIAIRLKELDWVETFLNAHKSYVDGNYREQVFGLAMVRLNYAKKDYTSAMRILAQSDFEDPVYNLLSKYMQLKMYYEEDEFDALESLLDSLAAHLRRKDIVESQKVNGKNIIRFTRGLLRMGGYDRKKVEELKKEIAATNPLTEKQWLLEMIG